MDYSRASSIVTATPMLSADSSDDESAAVDANGFDSVPASRLGSPSISSVVAHGPPSLEDDSVTCLWDDCGLIFTNLQVFIDHIHNEHIGMNKSNYTCEWATCHRRGLAQTSRFALISHIRSHTGEKPFVCTLPECDKSFTRSDALAKHMRLQHNIEPPAPGRGGGRSRKRKRGDAEDATPPPQSGFNSNTSAFRTFKVEQPWLNTEPTDEADVDYENYVRAEYAGRRDGKTSDDEDGEYAFDTLPEHLKHHYDHSTGLIMGRSPEMVLYILMKAKHKYALDQQEALLEELRFTSAELNRVREEKDAMMDKVLRATFGAEADALTVPIPMLPEMPLDQETAVSYTNGTSARH